MGADAETGGLVLDPEGYRRAIETEDTPFQLGHDGLAPGIHREVELGNDAAHGGPRSCVRAASTVWNCLNRIRPILLDWSNRYDHLREVARDDVLAALKVAHAKKIKAIVRNPTSHIKVSQQ